MSFMNLQKYYPAISAIFILILIASFFLWPQNSSLLAIAIIILGFGMSLALIIQQNREAKAQSKLPRAVMVRNIAIDALGLILVICAASFVGRTISVWAGNVAMQSQPGWGIFLVPVVGFSLAFATGWGMRIIWGKVARIIK
jgi:ABC-type bacteriocin/lantibiotic exporter with double-glycine peptidase domain